MEKAIRERLTGAVILFAALAILVPEMLSGPGDGAAGQDASTLADTGPPLTTYELSLDPDAPVAPRQMAPGEAAGTLSEAVVAPADPATGGEMADSAPPAASQGGAASAAGDSPPQDRASAPSAPPAPRAAEPAAAPGARPAAPAPARAPATTARTPAPAAAPAAASGQWWVQLGSFSSEQNARGLASRLRAKGFGIDVSKVRSGNRDLFRVRAGPEKSREAATALRGRLAAAGEQGTLVAP